MDSEGKPTRRKVGIENTSKGHSSTASNQNLSRRKEPTDSVSKNLPATEKCIIKRNIKSSIRQKLEQATSLESLIRRGQAPSDAHHINRDIAHHVSRTDRNLPMKTAIKRPIPTLKDVILIRKAWEDPMHETDGDLKQRVKQRPAVLSKVKDDLVAKQNKKLSRIAKVLLSSNVRYIHRNVAPKSELKEWKIEKNILPKTQSPFRSRGKVERRDVKQCLKEKPTIQKESGDKSTATDSSQNRKVFKSSIIGKKKNDKNVKKTPIPSARVVENSMGTFLTDIPVDDYPSENDETATAPLQNINRMKKRLQNNKKVMDDMILKRAESRTAPCHKTQLERLNMTSDNTQCRNKVIKERSKSAFREKAGQSSRTTGNIQQIIEERRARAAVRCSDVVTPSKVEDITKATSPQACSISSIDVQKLTDAGRVQPDKKIESSSKPTIPQNVPQSNPTRQAHEILNVLSGAEIKERSRHAAFSSSNRWQSSQSKRNNGESRDHGEVDGMETAASRLMRHAKHLGTHWAAADAFASKYQSLLDDLT
jgi:hypothetical protein